MFSPNILYSLDLLSTIIFATSGALLAREQRQTALTALFYISFTALGGGTMRDILLAQPIFWMRSPLYLLLALSIGTLIFYGVGFIALPRYCLNQLKWGDIVGLATFTIVGAKVVVQLPAFDFTRPIFWVLPPIMSLVTATGGGFIRDRLNTQKPSYISQHPAYICAALLGGFVYSCLASISATAPFAMGLAIATVMLIATDNFPRAVSRGHHKLKILVCRRQHV